ncbi:hypothetical protein [Streptomyces sp. AC555_RSS877]|uniref:hypothetical protein n=1 Tax=Streptomyces sp. AC555_RSS877 TaxID=2823688 RepID=UPI001C26017D|nr:hypothetical protein [Streptomyces sp. AC555_RSS877]
MPLLPLGERGPIPDLRRLVNGVMWWFPRARDMLGADLATVGGTSWATGKLPGMRSAPIDPLISNLRKICGG